MFSTKFVSAGKTFSTLLDFVPAPYIRRDFYIHGEVKEATITVCGLGFYDIFMNGIRITKGILAPYISNPDHILYYDYYELTPYLREGKNTVAFLLGNGMLNCPGGDIWDFQRARWRSAPKVAFSLDCVYDDGRRTRIEADGRCVCAPSPIYFDDLRVGEFYDARCEIKGWNLPETDVSAWTPAIHAETPRGECRFCEAEPITVRKKLKPVSIRRAKIGKDPVFSDTLPIIEPVGREAVREGMLYDFGENAAGNCLMRIHGRKGQKIILQYGELLDENGDLDLRSMMYLPKALNHRDIYICNGEGEETYTDRFAYHGFRYCLVIGIDNEQATEELLTYLVMNTELEEIGGFRSSSQLLNRLQQCVLTSDYSNFYYFPTDCPHREKNGWTGDAALSVEQMLLNLTPDKSYHEWMHNIRKAQREDGAIPGIIPTGDWGYVWGNGPAWDCIIVNIPYYLWKYRGDTDIIHENATTIIRYLHYIMQRRDERGLIHIGLGDWCQTMSTGTGGPTAPLCLTDTVVCIDFALKAEKCFRAVGMDEEAAYACAVKESFRKAARSHLIDYKTMTAEGRCQTSQAMAIYYDIFDESEMQDAFRTLLKIIDEDGRLMHLGVLGGRVLFHVLSAFGRTDLAYEMVTTSRFPSYGNWINRGATSMCESFFKEDEIPSSLNHHFWGDISHWMISSLAGLNVNPYDRDCNEVVIEPRFVDDLNLVEAHTRLAAGRINISWKREGKTILLSVEKPENCTGKIVCDNGMQFDDSTREKTLISGTYRIIPCRKP